MKMRAMTWKTAIGGAVFSLLAACGGGGGSVPPQMEPEPEGVQLPPPNPSNGVNYRTPEFNRNYGLGRINADAAYQRGYWGQGATVAIIDSGIRLSHNEFRNSGRIVAYRDFFTNGTIQDLSGHGTFIAGIIGGARDGLSVHGVAPSVSMIPIRIGGENGGVSFNLQHEIPAFQFALANGAHILNNSYGFLGTTVIGTYQGQTRLVNIPYFGPLIAQQWQFNAMNDVENVIGDKDAVVVWAAGNEGWQSGGAVELRRTDGSVDRAISIADLLAGFNAQQRLSNDRQLNGLLGTIRITVQETGAVLRIPESGSDFYALFPHYYPQLTDRWLAVVAINENENSLWYGRTGHGSNGCGDAKFWCISAPGANITSAGIASDSAYSAGNGTSYAAPHVSGALAVLKSRLPDMPMSVVRALLLRTADDLGAEGVDDVYGWGLVDLQKAVTVQGNVELAVDKEPQGGGGIGTGTGNGVRLMDARIDLPESFAALRGRLSEISVAVSVFGNAHYNTALESIAQVSSTSATLGAAAADMLLPDNDNRFSAGIFFAATDENAFRYAGLDAALPFAGEWRLRHDFCGEECEESVWKEWNALADGEGGTPFFAEGRESFMLEKRGEGLRPFASFSGEVHGEDRLQYRQFGLRWTGGGEGLSFSAELSEIRESESFLGASFGELGDTSAKTHQGRLLLRGGIGGGWEGFAFYERAHGEVEVSGGEFLQDVSDLQAWGWKAGLQRAHLLTGGDKFRFSFGRKTTVRRGEAALRYSRAVCSDGTAGDCFSEAAFGDVKGAPEIYTKREQEVRLENRELDLSSLSDLILSAGYSSRVLSDGEFSLGLEYNTASRKSAISAQLQIQF